MARSAVASGPAELQAVLEFLQEVTVHYEARCGCKLLKWHGEVVLPCAAKAVSGKLAWTNHLKSAHQPECSDCAAVLQTLLAQAGSTGACPCCSHPFGVGGGKSSAHATAQHLLQRHWDQLQLAAACLHRLSYHMHQSSRCLVCSQPHSHLCTGSPSLHTARRHMLQSHMDTCLHGASSICNICSAATPRALAPPMFTCPYSARESSGKAVAGSQDFTRKQPRFTALPSLNTCHSTAMPWGQLPCHILQQHLPRLLQSILSEAGARGSTSSVSSHSCGTGAGSSNLHTSSGLLAAAATTQAQQAQHQRESIRHQQQQQQQQQQQRSLQVDAAHEAARQLQEAASCGIVTRGTKASAAVSPATCTRIPPAPGRTTGGGAVSACSTTQGGSTPTTAAAAAGGGGHSCAEGAQHAPHTWLVRSPQASLCDGASGKGDQTRGACTGSSSINSSPCPSRSQTAATCTTAVGSAKQQRWLRSGQLVQSQEQQQQQQQQRQQPQDGHQQDDPNLCLHLRTAERQLHLMEHHAQDVSMGGTDTQQALSSTLSQQLSDMWAHAQCEPLPSESEVEAWLQQADQDPPLVQQQQAQQQQQQQQQAQQEVQQRQCQLPTCPQAAVHHDETAGHSHATCCVRSATPLAVATWPGALTSPPRSNSACVANSRAVHGGRSMPAMQSPFVDGGASLAAFSPAAAMQQQAQVSGAMDIPPGSTLSFCCDAGPLPAPNTILDPLPPGHQHHGSTDYASAHAALPREAVSDTDQCSIYTGPAYTTASSSPGPPSPTHSTCTATPSPTSPHPWLTSSFSPSCLPTASPAVSPGMPASAVTTSAPVSPPATAASTPSPACTPTPSGPYAAPALACSPAGASPAASSAAACAAGAAASPPPAGQAAAPSLAGQAAAPSPAGHAAAPSLAWSPASTPALTSSTALISHMAEATNSAAVAVLAASCGVDARLAGTLQGIRQRQVRRLASHGGFVLRTSADHASTGTGSGTGSDSMGDRSGAQRRTATGPARAASSSGAHGIPPPHEGFLEQAVRGVAMPLVPPAVAAAGATAVSPAAAAAPQPAAPVLASLPGPPPASSATGSLLGGPAAAMTALRSSWKVPGMF